MHAAGGHSAGLQFVRVRTRRGFVVIASDVSHFYENMASERPSTALHIGEMLEGFDRLLALASDESHIVPGHDPLVMKLYPAPSPQLEGIAVRLDVPPSGATPGSRFDFDGPKCIRGTKHLPCLFLCRGSPAAPVGLARCIRGEPGNCPICGMALEPADVPVDGSNPELIA
jgi:hypothetical protein